MKEPACYRLPLERYPGMNKFVLDWLHGDERFLTRRAISGPLKRSISKELVDAIVASNRRWGNEVGEELQRWAGGGTLTLVAGQQVGFAGGPLYTLAKLATLLKMKRDSETRGVPATVFFWLATEDHDFDEVAHFALQDERPAHETDLIAVRAKRTVEERRVVGNQPIPEPLISDFLSLTGIPRPNWLRPGITFADSFAELLSSLGVSVILIDSLLPELRRTGAPLLQDILRRWDEIQQAIAARSKALLDAGYASQVTPRPSEPYTLLFRLDEHGNRELLHDGQTETAAERLSTSALTRPLLQNFVLQPDVFVGGPAELAYFAQIAPLHAMLGVPMPRVALRGHALVGARALVRKFARFNIDPEDIFGPPENALAAGQSQTIAQLQEIAAAAEKDLMQQIETIRQLALPADHAVARSINRSIGHITYHFRKLTERATRALLRKDRERFIAARELVATFYPDRQVQDRVIAWVPYWLRFGEAMLDRLVSEIEPDAPVFKIVSI